MKRELLAESKMDGSEILADELEYPSLFRKLFQKFKSVETK